VKRLELVRQLPGPAHHLPLGQQGGAVARGREASLQGVTGDVLEHQYQIARVLDLAVEGGRAARARQPRQDVGFVSGLLVLHVVDATVGMRRTYVTDLTFELVLMRLQERMFTHMQRLPHGFYVRAKVGDLMARLSGDLNTVRQAMSAVVGRGLYLALRALVAGIALLMLSPALGGLVLLVVPIFALVFAAGRRRTRSASGELQRLNGQTSAFEQEHLSAHAVVKAFGLEGHATGAYRARLLHVVQVSMRLTRAGALVEASASLGTNLAQLLVLGVGGYLVMIDQLTIGTLLAAVGLLAAVFAPIVALSGVGQTMQQASGAVERLVELLSEPLTVADRARARVLPQLGTAIRFERVTFGYDAHQPVLRELDLTIPAGTHVAIVGPSGSGKTTLTNLLLRFWDPHEGRVLFDDQDLRDVTLASLRAQVGLVFQDTFVFDASVRENIGLGRPGATGAEIHAAAEAAQLGDYIASLPNGYDALLGERGVKMSGGQRQRLALARALLRDPRVLILDEATSALDTRTERQILHVLDAVSPGRTRISITHRLALAATADRILVLDRGRVVEQGCHAELITAGGLYARLYAAQTAQLARGGGSGTLALAA
jgi:ABC-type multidrug transport system fused ATPase/permease subunit